MDLIELLFGSGLKLLHRTLGVFTNLFSEIHDLLTTFFTSGDKIHTLGFEVSKYASSIDRIVYNLRRELSEVSSYVCQERLGFVELTFSLVHDRATIKASSVLSTTHPISNLVVPSLLLEIGNLSSSLSGSLELIKTRFDTVGGIDRIVVDGRLSINEILEVEAVIVADNSSSSSKFLLGYLSQSLIRTSRLSFKIFLGLGRILVTQIATVAIELEQTRHLSLERVHLAVAVNSFLKILNKVLIHITVFSQATLVDGTKNFLRIVLESLGDVSDVLAYEGIISASKELTDILEVQELSLYGVVDQEPIDILLVLLVELSRILGSLVVCYTRFKSRQSIFEDPTASSLISVKLIVVAFLELFNTSELTRVDVVDLLLRVLISSTENIHRVKDLAEVTRDNLNDALTSHRVEGRWFLTTINQVIRTRCLRSKTRKKVRKEVEHAAIRSFPVTLEVSSLKC